jgi:hypothetical protein
MMGMRVRARLTVEASEIVGKTPLRAGPLPPSARVFHYGEEAAHREDRQAQDAEHGERDDSETDEREDGWTAND